MRPPHTLRKRLARHAESWRIQAGMIDVAFATGIRFGFARRYAGAH